jgi:D-3-phosphoglycerate dehydrogenase
VNAIHVAEARGMVVERTRTGPLPAFPEALELRLKGPNGDTVVAGALLNETHPRIVRIDGFRLDLNPRGTLVIIRNRDVPGVVGSVSSVLGDAGINIAEYHQSRLEAGEQALAVIIVDAKLPVDLLEKLRQLPEVLEVRQAELD